MYLILCYTGDIITLIIENMQLYGSYQGYYVEK